MSMDAGEVAAVLKLRDEMSGVVAEAMRKVRGDFNKGGEDAKGFGSMINAAVGSFAGFVGAQVVMRGLSEAFQFAKSSIFGMNATLETSTLQFTTLMGDSDAAKAHVADLFEFAKKTPFETGPIIQASRMLRTFGGDALDTKANMQMLGDASAATGAPINELGFWVGRMYSQLQAGKPFGESAMRLSELAVMSPKARNEMESLQASGAGAKEVFAVFEKDLGKFTGAMVAQAGTWAGVTSTFTDTLQLLVAGGMKPLFEVARDLLGALNNVLGSDSFAKQAEGLSNAVRDGLVVAMGMAREGLDRVQALIQALQPYAQDLAIRFDALREIGEELWAALKEVAFSSETLSGVWATTQTVLSALWKVFLLVFDVVVALWQKLHLGETIAIAVQGAIRGLSLVFNTLGGALGWVADKIRWMLEAVGLLDKNIKPPKETLKDLGDRVLPKAAEAAVSAGRAVKDLGDNSDDAQKKVQALAEQKKKAAEAAKKFSESVHTLNTELKHAGKILSDSEFLRLFGSDLEKLSDEILKTGRSWKEIPKDIQDAYSRMLLLKGAAIDAAPGVLDLAKAFGELPKALQQSPNLRLDGLLPTKGDQLTGFLPQQFNIDTRHLTNAGRDAGKSWTDGLGGAISEGLGSAIQGALQGGGNVLQSIGGSIGGSLTKSIFGGQAMQKSITSIFGNTLGGAFNAILPGIGSLIGPLIGKIGSMFKNIFGPSEQYKTTEAAGQWERQNKDFIEYVQQLTNLAPSIKTAYEAIYQTHTVKDFQAAVANLNTEVAAYKEALAAVSKEMDKAVGGLSAFLQGATVTTQGAATAMVATVEVAFAHAINSGKSVAETIRELAPTITTLAEQLDAAGFKGTAAFDSLRAMTKLATDEVSGPMISAIGGLGQMLDGVRGSGFLTQEMFGGLAQQVSDTFAQLLAGGANGNAAMRSIQPTLQTLWEQMTDFEFEVDEATLALITQAKEAGLVGEAHRSAQEITQKAMEAAAVSMREVAETLKRIFGEAGSAAENFASRARSAIDNIPRNISIDVSGNYNWPELPDFSSGYPGFAGGTPGLGFKNFGSGTLAMLHGEEAVVPKNRAADFASMQVGGGVGEHGEGFNHMLAALQSIERLMRDQPEAQKIALADALALSR